MGALRKSLWLALALALVLFWAGAGIAVAAEYQITIARMRFSKPPTELHVGDVIVWQNNDMFRHTATARDKSFDIELQPSSEKRMTLTHAGAVEFYCRFHPGMKGSLDVSP